MRWNGVPTELGLSPSWSILILWRLVELTGSTPPESKDVANFVSLVIRQIVGAVTLSYLVLIHFESRNEECWENVKFVCRKCINREW